MSDVRVLCAQAHGLRTELNLRDNEIHEVADELVRVHRLTALDLAILFESYSRVYIKAKAEAESIHTTPNGSRVIKRIMTDDVKTGDYS